jgi:hypothetical protein
MSPGAISFQILILSADIYESSVTGRACGLALRAEASNDRLNDQMLLKVIQKGLLQYKNPRI